MNISLVSVFGVEAYAEARLKAEFRRVQPSLAEFRRLRPSSAEFTPKLVFEFGRVRPSSLKLQTPSRFVLGTRINKQLQAQALSVIKILRC